MRDPRPPLPWGLHRGRLGPASLPPAAGEAEEGRPEPLSPPVPARRLRATCSAKPLIKLYSGHGHFTSAGSS